MRDSYEIIRKRLSTKSTEELIDFLSGTDKEAWNDDEVVAARSILISRGVDRNPQAAGGPVNSLTIERTTNHKVKIKKPKSRLLINVTWWLVLSAVFIPTMMFIGGWPMFTLIVVGSGIAHLCFLQRLYPENSRRNMRSVIIVLTLGPILLACLAVVFFLFAMSQVDPST
jgi:hypothetical protein